MRVFRVVAAAILLLVGACRTPAGAAREVPPLVREGEVLLYLQPLPSEAERLEFTVASISALAADGEARPLELVHPEVTSSPPPRHRLLARGHLPPDAYSGFLVKIGRATLARGGERSDLLVAPEPARIEGAFAVEAGEATVLWASLRPRESLSSRYGFAPALTVASPPQFVPDLVGYCTNAATNDVTAFDRIRHQVVGTIATGRAPRGIALDVLSARAFVATDAPGEIEVIDVAQGRIVGRIRLDPGDSPRDVGLTPDGRVLVSVNYGTGTVSFLDPDSWMERSRVRVGELPTSVLVDRSGKRGYILNSGTNNVSVLDLDYASVAATFATESEPVDAALDRSGSVLYLALRGSPYLSAISVPGFGLLRKLFVGLGASSVLVDARTDRLYVGASGRSGIQVFDPAGFTPVRLIDLPDSVSRMTILNAENVMLALMPREQAVAAIDLTNGAILSIFDVGGAPERLAVSGVRR